MKKFVMFSSVALLGATACVVPQGNGQGGDAQSCVRTQSGMMICQPGAPAASPTPAASPSASPTAAASPAPAATPSPIPSPSPSPTPTCAAGTAFSISQPTFNDGWYGFDMAQSIAPTGNLKVSSIKLYLAAYHMNADYSLVATDPTKTWLDVTIYTDVGGEPNAGTAVATTRVTTFNSYYGSFQSIPLTAQPVLHGGSKYWIVAVPTTGPSDNVMIGSDTGDGYAGGEMEFSGGSAFSPDSFDTPGNDLTFEVDGSCN